MLKCSRAVCGHARRAHCASARAASPALRSIPEGVLRRRRDRPAARVDKTGTLDETERQDEYLGGDAAEHRERPGRSHRGPVHGRCGDRRRDGQVRSAHRGPPRRATAHGPSRGRGQLVRAAHPRHQPQDRVPAHRDGPGTSTPAEGVSQHAGEENQLCLEGEYVLNYDGQEFNIAAGDSASFDASVPHTARNPSGQRAVIVVAITPANF